MLKCIHLNIICEVFVFTLSSPFECLLFKYLSIFPINKPTIFNKYFPTNISKYYFKIFPPTPSPEHDFFQSCADLTFPSVRSATQASLNFFPKKDIASLSQSFLAYIENNATNNTKKLDILNVKTYLLEICDNVFKALQCFRRLLINFENIQPFSYYTFLIFKVFDLICIAGYILQGLVQAK